MMLTIHISIHIHIPINIYIHIPISMHSPVLVRSADMHQAASRTPHTTHTCARSISLRLRALKCLVIIVFLDMEQFHSRSDIVSVVRAPLVPKTQPQMAAISGITADTGCHAVQKRCVRLISRPV